MLNFGLSTDSHRHHHRKSINLKNVIELTIFDYYLTEVNIISVSIFSCDNLQYYKYLIILLNDFQFLIRPFLRHIYLKLWIHLHITVIFEIWIRFKKIYTKINIFVYIIIYVPKAYILLCTMHNAHHITKKKLLCT